MIRKYLNIIKYEFIMSFKESLRYKIGIISDFLIFTLTFFSIYYLNSGNSLIDYYVTNETTGQFLLLIGYILWQLSVLALGYSSTTVQSEARKGTLELKLQSRFSLVILLFTRMLISMFLSLFTFLGLIFFTTVNTGLIIKNIIFIGVTFIVGIPSILGMFGIGLILGGLSLKEKSIGQFTLIIQALLLFVSNVLSPNNSNIIYILPFPSGINIARNIYLNQVTPPSTIALYLVTNFLWLIIGILLFNKFLNYEKKYGSLDSY